MTVASNQYSSKLYSEHPIAIWPLDDDICYISLIKPDTLTQEQKRSFSNWSFSAGTDGDEIIYVAETADTFILSRPMPDSVISMMEYDGVTSPTPTTFTAYSPKMFNFSNNLNVDMRTFNVSVFLYTECPSVLYYEINYRYKTSPSSPYTYGSSPQKFYTTLSKTWIKLDATFNPAEYSLNVDVEIVVSAITGATGPFEFYVNGLSIGQWSEDTSSKSLGVIPETLPLSVRNCISSPLQKGVTVYPYGMSTDYGYILEKNNKLLARNYGIPMVFGSENVTKLETSENGLPSIIFPGKGVFNELGKYRQYTVEMWLRFYNNSLDSRRIWGPAQIVDGELLCDYGLYVKDNSIALVIGNNSQSYYISEWYRPMLLHICFRDQSVSVMINGEEVINLSYDVEQLSLPNKENDWVGIYSYEDNQPFEIDCYSVMPYIVPAQIAKKRFVWGQGVENPEDINTAFEGTVAYIDYPFAEYTSNKIYPDIARWDAGYFENLSADRYELSVPDYELPYINTGNKTLQDLYDNNYSNHLLEDPGHPYYVSFRPNNTWTDPCYILFPTLNILTGTVKSIYGVFEVYAATASSEPLIHFVNTQTSERFEINIDGLNITYDYIDVNGDITSYTPTTPITVNIDEHFVVGIDFRKLFDTFGSSVSEFFGNPAIVKVYVGGDGSSTFSGYIYRVGFSDDKNVLKIEDHFSASGIATSNNDALFTDHLASYTLMPVYEYNRFYLDIGVSSYWEEYFPLSTFAGYVKNINDQTTYDVDFIQYNISYPSNYTIDDPWQYEDLQFLYGSQTYSQFTSGFDSYDDLRTKYNHFLTYVFDHNLVKQYVTFQLMSDGINKTLDDFSITEKLPETRIIDADTSLDPFNTKFEIKDGVVIYPPKTYGIDNTAVVIYFDINIPGIKTNPIKIRKMSLSSKANSANTYNTIGTRFSQPLYPYAKNGYYYDFKAKNPYAISKESSPHLYLTDTSGIDVLGYYDPNYPKGIAMPINAKSLESFKVTSLQLWLKYSLSALPTESKTVFSIDSPNLKLSFIIEKDESGKRGVVRAINDITGEEYSGLVFYQNGVKVKNPYIIKNQWSVIGIIFNTPISFDNYLGYLNIHQSVTFKNVSFYQATALQEVQNISIRPWYKVLDNGALPDHEWQYWNDEGNWSNVLKAKEQEVYGASPESLYKAYTGTNRFVVGDSSGFVLNNNTVNVYSDIIWSEYVIQ